MRISALLGVAHLAAVVTGYAVDVHEEAVDVAYHIARALPNSPNGYQPSYVQCPANTPSIRAATGLSANETAFLSPRRNNTIAPMRALLNRINIPNFNASAYIDQVSNNPRTLPNIAIAASGGGWRACMNGGGGIAAMDSRESGSTGTGQLGGLLQSATYVAGLSGGGWLVSSIYINNFSTITSLRDSKTVWHFDRSIFEGPDTQGLNIVDEAKYWDQLTNDVQSKKDAGFEVSLTDFWGRALSYQLIDATQGGPAYTWSSIALMSDFQNGLQPMPLMVTDNRAPNVTIEPTNATVLEINPFEMGSWDPTLYAFAPLQYIGTNFTNGTVVDTSQCVVGYDNAGFMLGTSSTLFNEYVLFANNSVLPQVVQDALGKVLGDWNANEGDYADYRPNPFYAYNVSSNTNSNATTLTQVDGGEDNQNLPFTPLIQPSRNVDVIFAIDSSADTNQNWPNGTALVASYQRAQSTQGNGTLFPPIPDQNTIVNKGLNTRPVFYGCNASNMTNGINVPLIVYLPNYPYVSYSNESTITFKTNTTYRNAIIENGYDVVTMANGTRDSQWPVCVGCAILLRSLTRTNTTIPPACNQCFTKYCWDGSLNTTTPAPYYPTTYLSGSGGSDPSSGSGSGSNSGSASGTSSSPSATASRSAAARVRLGEPFLALAVAVGAGVVTSFGLI